MLVFEYRKKVREQLELLETMRNTLSSDNILKDILTELLEVGKLALCEKPTVFFSFIKPKNTRNENYKSYYALYQDGRPWGVVVACVSGKIITLVNGLTRASCFLRYGVEDLAYQTQEIVTPLPSMFHDEPLSADNLDISDDDLHIPNNIQITKDLPLTGLAEQVYDASAEQFLRTNLEHLLSWIEIQPPLAYLPEWEIRFWERKNGNPPRCIPGDLVPNLTKYHPLYNPYRGLRETERDEAKGGSMKHLLKAYISGLIESLDERSVLRTHLMYDATINVLLVYIDSVPFLSYPAYDQKNRGNTFSCLVSTAAGRLPVPILKQTIPLTPDSIRQWQTFGTIKPMPSVTHNPAKLRENLEKTDEKEITMKILRDLLAELAKEAYMRRRSAKFKQENYKYRTHFPIKADAKSVILSVDEVRQRR